MASGRRSYEREPIVDLRSGLAVGFEVLSRPEAGRLVEDHRGPSSAWWFDAELVLRDATAFAWDGSDAAVHLNLVASDLRRPILIACIARLPEAMRRRLVLEITEHEPIGMRAAVEAPIAALRQLGVRFAVDDFGEGWANLTMVDIVRPEILKVTGHTVGGDDRLARWVVELARSLQATTVYEMIETPEDLAWSKEMGFDQGQGYLWPSR